MNRAQFMERLDWLLRNIPEDEREAALQYYNDYFDDAGEENEAEIIRELGSPEKVAATIQSGVNGRNDFEEYGEYTEQGFGDSREWEGRQMPMDVSSKKKVHIPLVLLLILAVFCLPFFTGIAGTVLSGFVMLVALPAIFALALGISGIAVIIGGAICIVTGLSMVVALPAEGMLITGLGCIMLSVGMLLILATKGLMKRVVPTYFRKITDVAHRLLNKLRKGGRAS